MTQIRNIFQMIQSFIRLDKCNLLNHPVLSWVQFKSFTMDTNKHRKSIQLQPWIKIEMRWIKWTTIDTSPICLIIKLSLPVITCNYVEPRLRGPAIRHVPEPENARQRRCQEIFHKITRREHFCISHEIILFIINFLFCFNTLKDIVKVMLLVVYENANQITPYFFKVSKH